MHDGTPAIFSITVHNYLHAIDPGIWMKRFLLFSRLPLSPDISPFDFFFWDHLNLLCMRERDAPVATMKNLMAKIVVASADIASILDLFECVRQSFVSLRRLCYDLRGSNFEQLLLLSLVTYRCLSNVEL
ncbi:uncharacterized protein TNCV_857851 [Trichonephila clavipes]|nr:uncharacterized protein TNCV_857851 [Trichonephila clavipes]